MAAARTQKAILFNDCHIFAPRSIQADPATMPSFETPTRNPKGGKNVKYRWGFPFQLIVTLMARLQCSVN